MAEAAPKRRWPLGWIFVLILVGLYGGLKLQGWRYGLQSSQLERQLDDLRPALSQIILYEQKKKMLEAYGEALNEIQQLDLGGRELLEQLSRQVPDWMTLRKLTARSGMSLRIEGTCMPDPRDPEGALLSWAQRLQGMGYAVKVEQFFPIAKLPGTWRFELRAERFPDA